MLKRMLQLELEGIKDSMLGCTEDDLPLFRARAQGVRHLIRMMERAEINGGE